MRVVLFKVIDRAPFSGVKGFVVLSTVPDAGSLGESLDEPDPQAISKKVRIDKVN